MSGLTKFYYATMKNAPALNSEWGSMLDVLKACLLTGFNEQPISDINMADGIATATLGSGHGFLPYQVVAIGNNEYRVLTTTNTTIAFNATTLPTGNTVKTAGLGWVEKFNGDKKSIFEPKDKISNPFLLRVDNACPTGYDPSWAKFARVTLLEGANGIDDFAGFAKAPQYNADVINEQGDGNTGDNGIYGWAKWYHGVYYYQTQENRTEGQISNHEWVIVGDDSNLYFLPQITDQIGRANYSFLSIKTNSSLDKWAGFLSATEGKRRANQWNEIFTQGINTKDNRWWSGETIGKYILRPYNGLGNSSIPASLFSLNVGNIQQISGRTESLPFPNKPDNSVVLHNVYVKDSDGIRGILPIIQWINNRWWLGDKQVLDKTQGCYLILGTDYLNEGMTSFFAYKLEG